MAQDNGARAQPAMLVRIVGRIDFVKQGTANGKTSFLTLIKAPAPDPFSNPATVEVRSPVRLGGVGDDCDVLVTLKGYKNTGTTKEGNAFTRAQNVLELAS